MGEDKTQTKVMNWDENKHLFQESGYIREAGSTGMAALCIDDYHL